MKQFTLILTCATALLSGVVSAHPGHDGPITIIRARDLNSTDSTNSTAIADDYVPDLQAAECVCPEPICDPRMNAQSQCQCRAQALLACYIKSAGTCAKPADKTCS